MNMFNENKMINQVLFDGNTKDNNASYKRVVFELGEENLKINKRKEINNVKNNEISDSVEEARFDLAQVKHSYGTDLNFKRGIVWKNVVGFLILHSCALYGFYLCFTQAKLLTILWMFVLIMLGGEGITIGAHRLWSHRSFKATRILKAVLLVLQTLAGQNCLWVWVRDHRQHHRYSDSDADPHNARRGFFFSHIGWLMSKKHPLVIQAGKSIDMSDLEADRMVMFQKRFYKTLYVIFAMLIPICIPVLMWNENEKVSLFLSYFGRYVFQLHLTWSVNSVTHLYGTKPYDKNLMPVENAFVSRITVGEGWHNYHHAFPWDYKAGEWGGTKNPTAAFIEWCARRGLAYDLKKASDKMIQGRIQRAGDGSYINLQ